MSTLLSHDPEGTVAAGPKIIDDVRDLGPVHGRARQSMEFDHRSGSSGCVVAAYLVAVFSCAAKRLPRTAFQ